MKKEESPDRKNEDAKSYPRINFRLDQELRDKIEMDALAQGLSVGSYMKWLAGSHSKTRAVRRFLPEEKLLAQLKAEAGRVDGNLAQLLRLANRGEIVITGDVDDAARAVRDFYIKALEMLTGLR